MTKNEKKYRAVLIKIVDRANHYDGRGDGSHTLEWSTCSEITLMAANALGLTLHSRYRFDPKEWEKIKAQP